MVASSMNRAKGRWIRLPNQAKCSQAPRHTSEQREQRDHARDRDLTSHGKSGEDSYRFEVSAIAITCIFSSRYKQTTKALLSGSTTPDSIETLNAF